MKVKILQLIVTIVKGDAIGNETLMIDRFLRDNNIETGIYAENIGEGLENKNIYAYEKLPKLDENDVVIYHLCEATKINLDIKKMKCKKIARYHNFTPPIFFERFDFAQYMKQYKAFKEIDSLKSVFDTVLADSEYNKQNLISMGFNEKSIYVIPIMIDFSDYEKNLDEDVINKYSDDYVNILFVGRIVPNKKQGDVVRIFSYYQNYINKKSRLFLVGTPFSKKYDLLLQSYISELNCTDVYITNHVRFSEILAYYKIADVFLCMSEHEGFCVPLLEAMYFELPIIAYNSTAIPYTMNSSGCLVNTKNPVFISLIINNIINNNDLRNKIVDSQNKCLEKYSLDSIQKKFKEVIYR